MRRHEAFTPNVIVTVSAVAAHAAPEPRTVRAPSLAAHGLGDRGGRCITMLDS
jgi:hypothetical protein